MLKKEPPKILIVEDCYDTRQMIKYALKESGYRNLLEAEDGRQGLSLLNKERVSLVITDWKMPNMDGLSFFLLAKERFAPRGPIPFLMLTSEGYEHHVREALDKGIADYLLKPFNLQTLSTKVKLLLED